MGASSPVNIIGPCPQVHTYNTSYRERQGSVTYICTTYLEDVQSEDVCTYSFLDVHGARNIESLLPS